MLGPVAARNRIAGGEFLPTTSQLGTNLYIGNNPAATGVYVPLRYGREEPAEEQQDARELAEAGAGRRLTPSEVSAWWRDRALAFAREQPGAWLRLMGRKALLTLNATEVPDAYDQYTFGDWSALLRWLDRLAHFGVLLALAAAGLVLSWGRRRALWPLHALIAAYAGSVALFYVFSRYRLPLVPLLAPFAALALVEGAAHARARRWRALALPAAAAALAGLVALAPLTDKRRCRATMLTNIAHRLVFEEGRSAEAIPYLLEVVRLLPDFALGHYHLGAAYARTGRPAEGLAALERAAALLPAYPQTWLELGRIERSRRRPAAAAAWLERGLRHDPRDRSLLLELGKALTEDGRPREAAAAFERARLLYPADVEILANAGQTLVDLGEHREGAARIEAAIRARGGTWGAAELYLGLALAGQGRGAEAEPHLRAALREGADPARAARALEGLGRAPAAAPRP